MPQDDPTIHVNDPWTERPSLTQLTRHDIWSLRRGFLERLWPHVEGWQVLEVGSGPAHDALTFAERGAEVTALDCSDTGLALARRFYQELDLEINTIQAQATSLPVANQSFDLAFNAGVLEHFDDADLEQVIDEMARSVRPGGHVLAFCPNRYNIFYQHHLKRTQAHPYDFERAFAAHELKQRFEARGLLSVQVSGVHVHPAPNYLLPSWLPKHHRIEPVCRDWFKWLEKYPGMNGFKSFIGQDFVVWGQVSAHTTARRSTTGFGGGPAVRIPTRQAVAAEQKKSYSTAR